jgi:alpha-L-fucosidase
MKRMKNSLLFIFLISVNIIYSQANWKNPIIKQGRIGSPLVETSPFVMNGRLYLLENHQKFWEIPDGKPGDRYTEDEIRIRDIETDSIVSIPLKNHGFGTVLVFDERVYVFAGNYGVDKPWRQIQEVSMVSSSDLLNWTEPITVYRTFDDEYIFNTAVCKGEEGFILLVETNDNRWPAFTFKYYTSNDLITWQEIPGAIFGKDKYVGGPALYFEGGWYYTLYLENINNGYETRIARSINLIDWQTAPEDRPFLTFDPSHKNIPLLDPSVSERNASDPELTFYEGKTVIYFTGSDQTTAGDLQWATFDGTPQELFECFFQGQDISDLKAPEHEGDWIPVLISPHESVNSVKLDGNPKFCRPTARQLAYQERQLGAFIHFGPATFIESDFLSTPSPEIFNPTNLNADQWIQAAVSFGAQHVVLTVKHHNGFCLWPTNTTEYSVSSSPWKNGEGDVVREFVSACRKYGVKPGFYISGGDKHIGCWSTGDAIGQRKIVGDIHSYFPVFLEQLREILTNYGEIDIIWIDGAYDPFGWDVMRSDEMGKIGTEYGDAIRSMINHLQPEAVVFGGTRPDIRWSGSEQGWAPYPLWNCVTENSWRSDWVGPDNLGWIPAEANIHTRSRWFWAPDTDKTLKNADQLFEAYIQSVGRGANLLINMTPDTTGVIPPLEIKNLRDFGEMLKISFGAPLIVATNPEVIEGVIEVEIPTSSNIQYVEIEEDLKQGQRILNYALEYYHEGKWLNITEGLSVGRKRLHKTTGITTGKLRLVIKDSNGQPVIRRLAVY